MKPEKGVVWILGFRGLNREFLLAEIVVNEVFFLGVWLVSLYFTMPSA
jgi:hypothetical protein